MAQGSQFSWADCAGFPDEAAAQMDHASGTFVPMLDWGQPDHKSVV